MTYQVLARAWRPQKFDDLLGQEAVVTTLCNALAGGTLGHAYLFTGLRGVGKTTAARLLAKAVNCVEGPTPRPCGACPSCLEVAAGASLDVVELDAATHTGVDDVRDLQELLRYRPVRDRYRVLIVDEVHMLSKAAFNALLKTVEEPPPYILWVLATTERHKVPATILSRCQQLEFRPLAADLIAAHLGRIAEREGFQLAPAAAGVIARSARGSVRDALSLLDQLRAFASDRVDEAAVAEVLGVPRLERLEELVRAAVAGDGAAMLGLLRSELTAGRDPSVLYHETGRLLKSLLHLAVDPELEADLVAEQRERMLGLARQIGSPALTRMLGLWVEQEGLLRDAASRELALEVALLRLARWPAVRQVEALLDGEAAPPAPAGGSGRSRPGSDAGGAGRAGAAGPAAATAAELWDDRPRLAAAVGAARVEREGAPAEAAVDIGAEALADPAVQSALRVLGGELVEVRPDRTVS